MSTLIRDLSEVMEGKDGVEGESKGVLKANINNIEFYNELLPLFSVFEFPSAQLGFK